MPMATSMVGALLITRSRRLPPSKNDGAMTLTIINKTTNAAAADTSRLYLSMPIIFLISQRYRQDLVLRRVIAVKDLGNCSAAHYGNAITHPEDLRQFG